MRNLKKHTSLRSAISLTLSVALVLSMLVIPAGAAVTPSTYVASSLAAGTTKAASVLATNSAGLEGQFIANVDAVAGIGAEVKSSNTLNATFAGANVLGLTLHIYVEDGASSVTTDVVCAPTDTTNDLLAKINAINGKLDASQAGLKLIAARLPETGQPYIRTVHAGSNMYMEIWDDYPADTVSNGVADYFVYGPASLTQTNDLSTAAGNPLAGSLGRASAYGVDSVFNGVDSSFLPVRGSKYATGTVVTAGSWVNGVVSASTFRAGIDTETGQYTGFQINDRGFEVLVATADRASSFAKGQLTFLMGSGVRADSVGGVVLTGNTETRAGMVTTLTAQVSSGAWTNDPQDNAIDSLVVKLPAGFTATRTAEATIPG
ncbi:MAG: hypothetical protein FDZ75_02095, partial [Actinobacteria bacterium]